MFSIRSDGLINFYIAMRVFSWNANGLASRDKIFHLFQFHIEQQLDVLFIQETKIKNLTPEFYQLFSSNYTILHTPKGQGILTVLKNSSFLDFSVSILDKSVGTSLMHQLILKKQNRVSRLNNLYQAHSSVSNPHKHLIQSSCASLGDFNVYLDLDPSRNPVRYEETQSLADNGQFISPENTYVCLGRLGSNLGPDLLFQSHTSQHFFEKVKVDRGKMKFIGNASSYHLPLIFQTVEDQRPVSSTYVEKSFNYSHVSVFDLESAHSSLPDHPALTDYFKLWDSLLSRCAVKKPRPNANHFFTKISNANNHEEFEILIESFCKENNSLENSGKLFNLIRFLTAAKENAEQATSANHATLNLKSQKTAFGEFAARVSTVKPLSKTKKRQYYRARKWFWKQWFMISNKAERFSMAELNETLKTLNKRAVGFDFLPFAWLPKEEDDKLKFLNALNDHLFNEYSLHGRFTTGKLTFIKKADGSARPITTQLRLACVAEIFDV